MDFSTYVSTYVPLTGLWSTMSDAEITSLYLTVKANIVGYKITEMSRTERINK